MLAVFSKDAGGAENLSSYIKRNKSKKIFFLKGPAIGIFKKKFPKLKNINFKEIKNYKINSIITSTSSKGNHELAAIEYAKKNKIKSISILDSWINYKKRFRKKNKYYYPNEIWTVDKSAYNLSKNLRLPNVKLKKNYFLLDTIEYFKKLKIKKNYFRVLYLDSTLKKKDKQKKRIEYFIQKINEMNLNKKFKIYFRPHPSEKLFFYEKLLKKNRIKIINIKKESVIISIAKSNYVFGCNSMGMYIASKFNLKVINALPENDIKMYLPIKNISLKNFKIND